MFLLSLCPGAVRVIFLFRHLRILTVGIMVSFADRKTWFVFEVELDGETKIFHHEIKDSHYEIKDAVNSL